MGAGDAASNPTIDRRTAGNIRSAVIWFRKAIALNDGDACIELAKLCQARKGGQESAVALLRRALKMNRNYKTEGGRQEAESLPRELVAMPR